jgi:hypothetical protein
MRIKTSPSVILLIFFLLSFLAAQLADAAQLTWNGFASFYGRKSLTVDTYDLSLNQDQLDLSNGTRVGLNLRDDFEDGWAFVGQLLAAQRGLGNVVNNPPNWSPQFDWAFLSYDPTNEINVRVGRQIFPASLTSEYQDVGLAYPWRKLPAQFFAIAPFKSFEGISFAYQLTLGRQNLNLRLFGGNSEPDLEPGISQSYQVNNLSGVALTYEGNNWRIRATAAQFVYVANFLATQTTPAFSFAAPQNKYFEIGGTYDQHNIMAYAEYVDVECPGSGIICYGRSYFGTLGYHLGNFLPHVTYSYGEANFETGFIELTSNAIGLNYQINPSIVLKAEYLIEQGLGPVAGGGPAYISAAGVARSTSLGFDVVF